MSINYYSLLVSTCVTHRDQTLYFYFFKRPEHYNQEVLSHSFICLPLPYVEGIVLMCNIDLHCVIAIFNGTGDMFNHRGTKGILLFFQKTRTLQSRGVATFFHLFAIAIYGRNCFDMQH